MRKFKTTPQKKFLGMIILFVLIPLFLLWYWVFFLDHKPGPDTIVILAAVALLGAYAYSRYKKQLAAKAESAASTESGFAGNAKEMPEDGAEEDFEEGEEAFSDEDAGEELPPEEEEPAKKRKSKK